MSDYELQIIEDNNFYLGKSKKNIPNLVNRRKYKLYCQNLKLYLSLGLQLKNKIHRILEFREEPFLKPYIKRNRELQGEAEKEGNKIKKNKNKMVNQEIMLYLVNW